MVALDRFHCSNATTYQQSNNNCLTPLESIVMLSLSSLSLLAIFTAATGALAQGGFTASCYDVSFQAGSDGYLLEATCPVGNGFDQVSVLTLNQCLGNEGGNLVWQPG